MPRLLRTDDEGYDFIVKYFIQNGRPPSYQVIAKGLGYGSKRSVQLLIGRLVGTGRINLVDGRIDLASLPVPVGGENTVPVPIVGSVACGALSLAEENFEDYVEISTVLAKPGYRYFVLRARGNSMNLSGIDDGDLVLVRQQPSANEGDRVVAFINGEATIKHFHREKGLVILRPNSSESEHRSIVLSDSLTIQGVVISALPRL